MIKTAIEFIADNAADIIVLSVLLIISVTVIIFMRKNTKKKSSCGGCCSGCSRSSNCTSEKEFKIEIKKRSQ